MTASEIRLGVNVDNVATVRQARGTDYPDPVEAGLIAAAAGADSITIHLREDRRHIQEHDVRRLKARCPVPINLEMAVTDDMLAFACRIKPRYACLVPERRQELTTEGGLDVAGQRRAVTAACARLARAGIETALRVFEKGLLADLGYALSLPPSIDAQRRYRYAPDRGPVEDPNGVAGASLIALREERFDSADVRRDARRVLRSALRVQLGDRELESARLLRELRRGS